MGQTLASHAHMSVSESVCMCGSLCERVYMCVCVYACVHKQRMFVCASMDTCISACRVRTVRVGGDWEVDHHRSAICHDFYSGFLVKLENESECWNSKPLEMILSNIYMKNPSHLPVITGQYMAEHVTVHISDPRTLHPELRSLP